MYDLASSIDKPIALAALALLVLSAVFTAMVRKRGQTNPLLRDIARYCFIIGLVFGVLAIPAYTMVNISSTEYRVSGIVLDDTTGEPIDGADVAVVGGITKPTTQDGSFEFSLPRARFSNGYTLNISESQYHSESVVVTANFSTAQTIRLRPKLLSEPILDRIIYLTAGHWIGRPALQLSIRLLNANDATVAITKNGISATLKSATGVVQDFEFLQVTAIDPPPSATNNLYLHAGKPVIVAGFLFQPNDQFLALSARVNNWVAQHPFSQNPNELVDRIDQPLVADLQKAATENFFWSPGKWTLSLIFRCTDKSRKYDMEFGLTAEQVARMKTNIAQYRYGFGVLNQLLFAGTGPDRGLVQVDNFTQTLN